MLKLACFARDRRGEGWPNKKEHGIVNNVPKNRAKPQAQTNQNGRERAKCKENG